MPYLPEVRQYRNFAATNFQPVPQDSDSEVRTYSVKGHFTEFESEYPLVPGFFEVIDRHALDQTDMSDVLFQFNHSGMVLSRLRNGSLKVGTDERGGWAKADLGGCQQGRDLYEAISNGLIDRMSFGFTIADDGVTYEEDDEGNIHSRITKIDKLFDVSAVDLPASEYTDISARSYADAVIEARDKRREAERRSEEQPEETPEDKPAFTDEEIEAIANALERRAKERKAQDDVTHEEEERRELPDFLKDDDDDDEDEKRDCQEDEEQRESQEEEEEQQRAARSRRSRRMLALSLIDI